LFFAKSIKGFWEEFNHQIKDTGSKGENSCMRSVEAILVVNDAAREKVPEELQCGLILTIYEAKGLEFDDILLYNFFKDSQVNIILLLIVAIVIVW
jgi:DNA helicase IV